MSSDSFLKPLLVCPLCKEDLTFLSDTIRCTACGESFPQRSGDWFNLLPDRVLESDWKQRQDEMEEWYKNLAANEDWAAHCFANDYQPFSSFLATLSGSVLDLGGGNGVVRHYLPEGIRYVTLDPSLDWLGAEWTSLAHEFPCLETAPPFVRGVGEHLPFPAQTFDAVVAFWTLNHVSYPEQVFQEVHRVLKSGGRFLAVLEDMEPQWRDLLDPSFRQQAMPQLASTLLEHMTPQGRRLLDRITYSDTQRQAAAVLLRKLQSSLPGQTWPTQDDHIQIHESGLQRWSEERFEVRRRSWKKHYLTYEFRKRRTEASAP